MATGPGRSSRAARYALALTLVLAMVALRWALIPVIGSGTLYSTIFPAMQIRASVELIRGEGTDFRLSVGPRPD